MTKRKVATISLFQLIEHYPTKEDVMRYFERIRWGDKVGCGATASAKQSRHKSGRAVLVWVMSTILYRLDKHAIRGRACGFEKMVIRRIFTDDDTQRD